LRLLAYMAPVASRDFDAAVSTVNLERAHSHRARSVLGRARGLLRRRSTDEPQRAPAAAAPEPLRYPFVPVDEVLKVLEGLLARAETSALYSWIAAEVNWLSNPARVAAEDVRWLLREGGEREPRKVVEQFARWIRKGELVCYRTGYDFKRGFSKIDVPMAIIFGDRDPLASVASTRTVYRMAQSEYLLWRPVKGNSHIELTMGHDIRQICYDIKNLIEYARTHRGRAPRLPRRAGT
jgi:hypothetical protein